MTSIISDRIPYSQIRVMFDAARELEKSGREIIHLEIGRPDYNTPSHIVESAVEALRAGKHHYAPNAGIIELRRAIAEKYRREYKLTYRPESEILVTNGVTEGIFLAVNALLNPGDQVLIPDPRWVSYEPAALAGLAEPVSYRLFAETGFQPDPDEIEDLITPRTRMLILSSPSNPTGGLIHKDRLEKIADLALKHELIILSDEVYEKIIYPPARHTTPAAFPAMKESAVILNGFSKFYSMTGWRLGYALGPENLINPMLRYHQYMITSTNTFAQWGAVKALTGEQGPSLAMLDEFHKRRDFIHQAACSWPGFSCHQPSGAFFLFPSIEETGMSGYQMSRLLLEKAGVATVAGECFGRTGAGHIRISYASSMDNLKKAAEKIGDVVRGL
jgi:aspartate/methionine/tyrosine aminotransferase